MTERRLLVMSEDGWQDLAIERDAAGELVSSTGRLGVDGGTLYRFLAPHCGVALLFVAGSGEPSEATPQADLLSITDASRNTGVPSGILERWIKRGDLPCYKFAGLAKRWVKRAEVDEVIANLLQRQ